MFLACCQLYQKIGEALLRDIMLKAAAVVSFGVLWSCGGVIFKTDLGATCCMLCC